MHFFVLERWPCFQRWREIEDLDVDIGPPYGRRFLRKKKSMSQKHWENVQAQSKKVVPDRTPCNAMRPCVIKFNVMQVLLFDFIEGNQRAALQASTKAKCSPRVSPKTTRLKVRFDKSSQCQCLHECAICTNQREGDGHFRQLSGSLGVGQPQVLGVRGPATTPDHKFGSCTREATLACLSF